MTNVIDITPHLENKKAMDNFKKADLKVKCLDSIGFGFVEPKLNAIFGDVKADLEKLTVKEEEK